MMQRLNKDMTKQEVYDALVAISRDGGFPSMTPGGRACAYRGEGNRACAVGVFLPDDVAHRCDSVNPGWGGRRDR